MEVVLKERLDACLLLGCNGLIVAPNFCNCGGVENNIVDLMTLEEKDYIEMMNFFDDTCDLFNSPINDYNKCVNILTMLNRDFGIINSAGLHNIQMFLKSHKSCGIYLFLLLKEDMKNDK